MLHFIQWHCVGGKGERERFCSSFVMSCISLAGKKRIFLSVPYIGFAGNEIAVIISNITPKVQFEWALHHPVFQSISTEDYPLWRPFARLVLARRQVIIIMNNDMV